MTTQEFQKIVLAGIPAELPSVKEFDKTLNHAPKRKDILNEAEKKLALRNALRYFDKKHHAVLAKEFAEELKTYGRIYMYRFRPDYKIYARPITDYPHKSLQAAAIMHMLSNNLDYAVAQHPHELITYGGNGAVFQNWAQYLLTMQYLATITDEQTLTLYSGHPMGLFPSHKEAPRVVITNGMMIPNYSKPDDWEKFNALGVTQYGQMTAGSFMYIGPQGIVHGTTITVMNAARKVAPPTPQGGNAKRTFSYETADKMAYGLLKDFVKEHRSNPTEAEKCFWELVRGKNLENYKFRRQHIIGQYIVDFVCLDRHLIVEIDGLIHQLPDNKSSDEERTKWLSTQGFKVIRFTNEEIISDTDNVLKKVVETLNEQTSNPPVGGGGAGLLFVTCGLGGMSGAQPKAAKIAGLVSVTAEINPKAAKTRHTQGWVDEVHEDLDELITRIKKAVSDKEAVSLAYQGNVVDLWERLVKENIKVDIGTDQTSLHNPWAGGYYPTGLSYEESNKMMADNPAQFKKEVQKTLVRHANAVNTLAAKGMYFFDYGNAFLLEASRAGADIVNADGTFKYKSYVQDILGPMCFDYGFGPFRWVCTSADAKDLKKTDELALAVLQDMYKTAPDEIKQQLSDNIAWIKNAMQNNLVVGSQARILYADSEARIRIAEAINKAIANGELSAPVVLGRDHHDVSGTDSPYRETSNIYDGSQFTADMAVQNFVGDAFRGATWISLHNGGGVGWGEVMNGGFGLVLDGSADADRRLKQMLFWDVNNGIARRSWARNKEALFAIKREMQRSPDLKVTLPNLVDDSLLEGLI
jgi:urocanate hydratase